MDDMTAVFALPPQFTVDRVEEMREQMIKWLHEAGEEIKCCGSDVTVMDTAGLQLLLAFYKAAVRDGKKFVIVNPSTEMQDVFTYSAADKIFAMEEVG